MIAKLVVIGVGLIGGSLACALRKAGVVDEVVGVGRGLPNLKLAVELGVIDRLSQDATCEVATADIVVIGATLGATASILETIAPALGPQTVVTDVGSTKASVVTAARAALGNSFTRFVPGHPIAGTEHSGAQAAFAELYLDHRVILTPVGETCVVHSGILPIAAYGTSLYGWVDVVPEYLQIRTMFWHFRWIPLIPLQTWVLAYDPRGLTAVKNLPIRMSLRSVAFVGLQWFLNVALVGAMVYAVLLLGSMFWGTTLIARVANTILSGRTANIRTVREIPTRLSRFAG